MTEPERCETLRDPLGERFDAAFLYAHEAHRHQPRKGTCRPYISHLMAVAAIVLEEGGSEDLAIAALLHDVAEDAGGEPRLREIADRFGDDVARTVAALSDTFETPKPPWRARKEAYLRHLEGAGDDVILVSLADKLHNLRSILADHREHGDALWARFNPDADPLWYYGSLLEVYARRRPGPLVDEMRRTLEALRERLPADGQAG
jgi:(p)ppGpp synthase/HD superfamily hydrolase